MSMRFYLFFFNRVGVMTSRGCRYEMSKLIQIIHAGLLMINCSNWRFMKGPRPRNEAIRKKSYSPRWFLQSRFICLSVVSCDTSPIPFVAGASLVASRHRNPTSPYLLKQSLVVDRSLYSIARHDTVDFPSWNWPPCRRTRLVEELL